MFAHDTTIPVPLGSNVTPTASQHASHDSVDLSDDLVTPVTTPVGLERRNDAPTAPDDPSTHPDTSSTSSSHGITKTCDLKPTTLDSTGLVPSGVEEGNTRRNSTSRGGLFTVGVPANLGVETNRSQMPLDEDIARIGRHEGGLTTTNVPALHASSTRPSEAQEAPNLIKHPNDIPEPQTRAPMALELSPALRLSLASPTRLLPAENTSRRVYHLENAPTTSPATHNDQTRRRTRLSGSIGPPQCAHTHLTSSMTGESCLRHKLTRTLGTAGRVGVVGTTQNDVDNAKTNLPGSLTLPTHLLEAADRSRPTEHRQSTQEVQEAKFYTPPNLDQRYEISLKS